MSGIHIRKTEILSDEHYTLKKITFDLKKNNGEWDTQQRVVFDHGNAAAALLYNKVNKKVILTKQVRIPTFINGNPAGTLLEICAGLLEEGESPEDTIKREILEETGYEINELQKVYEAYSSAGSLTELIHLYLAPYSDEQKKTNGGGLAEEGEEIRVMEMPFTEAIELLKKGEIKDAKTIILLQYAQLNNLL